MIRFDLMETPALILDAARFEANARRMLAHCAARGVYLRPHIKTLKSVDAAHVATGGRAGGLTVSTLKEAEHFARAGFDDLLYAVGITPNKFGHVARIMADTGKRVTLVLDSVEMARALVASGLRAPAMIEIDCGEHRGGLGADDPALVEIGHVLGSLLAGVMTHAGQSYGTDDPAELRRIAAAEVSAAVLAAGRLRAARLTAPIVSIGSTPTVLHAENLAGVTEVRAGIYLAGDLCQFGRGICGLEDIAVTVLASVIGHNRAAGVLTLDAGALALSKDIGAERHLPGAGYGWVCCSQTLAPSGLVVGTVHQEHGSVRVPGPEWFDRLPIGAQVRVLPVHACLTAAGGYGRFHLTDGRIWPRVDGW